MMKVIAHIHTDFPEKFGVPRQSGLAETKGLIVFEPEYRNIDALRGLEEYSHLWLLWEFSEVRQGKWSPTVRPPRLGGNKRMGVFATRSPFRPNPIGLSCVRLERIEMQKDGPVMHVSGIDMTDGSPIYDVKPYLPYTDAVLEAQGGFGMRVKDYGLLVEFPEKWLKKVPDEHRKALKEVLRQDPRPSYQEDPERVYGMSYGRMQIRFTVKNHLLTVCEVECAENS